MKGSVHYDKNSKRWFVSVYWEGNQHRFWRHPLTGEPFWHRKSADKQLNRIRTEIDENYFNPKHWLPDSPMSIRKYAEDWLDCIDVSRNNTVEFIWIMSKFSASTRENIEQLIRTPTMRALLSAHQARINELFQAFEESPEVEL